MDPNSTTWTPLSETATWKSPALFIFEMTRNQFVSSLGAPHEVDLDSNGVGLYDAWGIGFPCGLQLSLWFFHCRGPGFTLVGADELAYVEVHANERDVEHIRFHIPVPVAEVWRMTPDQLVTAPKLWTVVRQDDNGHRYQIEHFTSRCEADAAASAYEARGHKQMYWVEGQSSAVAPSTRD